MQKELTHLRKQNQCIFFFGKCIIIAQDSFSKNPELNLQNHGPLMYFHIQCLLIILLFGEYTS